MKKLGLAVAVVLGMASVAQAQVGNLDDVITATATIEQDLSLAATDVDFDCGIVNPGSSTTCLGGTVDTTGPDADLVVTANSTWKLVINDAVGTRNAVRLGNTSGGRPGSFDIALAWGAGCTVTGNDCTGLPTPTSGTAVKIVQAAPASITGGDGSAANLGVDDQHGAYSGPFTVTLSATN